MVDSYLDLARRVLKRARKPLTPREILRQAYSLDLVPYHLHGTTQHKTLQARLSEHIIAHRDTSLFFRTAPGRFFLRSFMTDETIPAEFRRPIVARRRVRELRRRDVLTLPKDALPATETGQALPLDALHDPIKREVYHYLPDLSRRSPGSVAVWSFVIVLRDSEVLTYRQGRYREDRDAFHERRSIGFYAPVIRSDLGLFDQEDHGLVASGLSTLAIDLDLVGDPTWNELAANACFKGLIFAAGATSDDLLGLVRLDFPSWYEPLTRRLAINDLSWQDLSIPTNHVEDYDPWSRIVLDQAQRWARECGGNDKAQLAGGD